MSEIKIPIAEQVSRPKSQPLQKPENPYPDATLLICLNTRPSMSNENIAQNASQTMFQFCFDFLTKASENKESILQYNAWLPERKVKAKIVSSSFVQNYDFSKIREEIRDEFFDRGIRPKFVFEGEFWNDHIFNDGPDEYRTTLPLGYYCLIPHQKKS